MKAILSSRRHYLKRAGVFLIALALIVVGTGGGPPPPLLQYTLTISSTAGGAVTTPGEGTFTYEAGTVVNLVATPEAGYQFVNWTGDVGTIADVNAASTTITMNDDYSITANFAKIPSPTFKIPSPTFIIGWFDFEKQGTYAIGEPVVVLMILLNETQEPITVNERFAVNEQTFVEAGLGEVFFVIRDAANNPLPFLPRVTVFHPEAEDFTTLQPGELTVWVAELTLFYDLARVGVYTVQAVYRSEIVPAGIKAWVGVLESNTLTLTIIEERR